MTPASSAPKITQRNTASKITLGKWRLEKLAQTYW